MLIKLAILVARFEVVEFWVCCVCKWCFATGKMVTVSFISQLAELCKTFCSAEKKMGSALPGFH